MVPARGGVTLRQPDGERMVFDAAMRYQALGVRSWSSLGRNMEPAAPRLGGKGTHCSSQAVIAQALNEYIAAILSAWAFCSV